MVEEWGPVGDLGSQMEDPEDEETDSLCLMRLGGRFGQSSTKKSCNDSPWQRFGGQDEESRDRGSE